MFSDMVRFDVLHGGLLNDPFFDGLRNLCLIYSMFAIHYDIYYVKFLQAAKILSRMLFT